VTAVGVWRWSLIRILPFALAIGALTVAIYQLIESSSHPFAAEHATVRVLSYSAFVASWGPGPEIARRFYEQTGMNLEFQEADDAGLLLRKLEIFPADVVLGFDQLTLDQARAARPWRSVSSIVQSYAETENLRRWSEPDFLVFDWAPLSFVYRKGEVEPPRSFADLLDSRFKAAIALEDPRTSTPGLQFMFWVLDEMGIEEGFAYLKSIQPQLQSVSASWSTAYGLFTQKQAKLAFSYETSPIYHEVEEKNFQYAVAVFDAGHVAQFEYAGIPTSCDNCSGAEAFLKFLVQPEIQKIIMQKNNMFPVLAKLIDGTPFEHVPKVTLHLWKNLPELLKRRDELLKRWQEIGM